MDRDIAIAAARRLLKSHLRLHIGTALAEEAPRWTAFLEVERGNQQQAQDAWNKIQASWGFDDLGTIVGDALGQAAHDAKASFEEVKSEEWINERVERYVKSFNFLNFLNDAKED